MLTATEYLRVKGLGIVLVEDVGGDVGGIIVVNHCCFRRGGEDRGSVGRGVGR